jgi:hypothetical protein
MKFDLNGLETYQTDKELESQIGIWLKFPGDRKIHVLRAGGSNTKFIRIFNNKIKPHERQMKRGTLDPDLSNDIIIDAYLEAVVLGWSGFKDEEGNEIPYSKEAARELFKALPELFNDVVNYASDLALFQEEEAKEIGDHMGNS